MVETELPDEIRELERQLDRCILIDRPKLRDRVRTLLNVRNAGRPVEGLDVLRDDIHRSAGLFDARAASRPSPTFPDKLPVVQRRHEIAQAIAANQVIILCGETGSGKTTQLPKICLELGRGVAGLIGHTQPRRIAARSVAARIAAELQSPLGRDVGYKVRFSDRVNGSCFIKIMTDGILLAETQRDRSLLQYDTIIVDEAHERSLNIDFLLGYLKLLLPKRPELKVIVTSATIDPQKFSRHFEGAPIIEVSGRTYPVEVRYRAVQADEPDEEDPTIQEAMIRAVEEVTSQGDGDVLVFLSGEREIREAVEALRKHHPPATELLPLYARLSVEDQHRVFEPHAARRIILATNVAETSLTVPGIRYVIDPGFARVSRYSPNSRVQRLPIEPISKASADQRKGRCGRVAAGLCVRLYSEEDFHSRVEFTDPEILRANLASVILQMKALRLGDLERFPFIDPPRSAMIREGYQTLTELGAIDRSGMISSLGKELARLPVDPRIGRMILAARQENCLHEMLIVASALATQDPRLRPLDAAKLSDAAHRQFADDRSDFVSFLKLWEFYHHNARDLSTSKLRKLCEENFLSFLRFREWHDVHRQLHAHVTESGMKVNQKPARQDDIHRALLAGLISNIGFKNDGNEYLGVRDRKFGIFPGSHLFQQGPKWIMAAELVETTRLYARTVARIQPEWIEQLAPELLKRTHTAPYWNRRSAHVEAFERVSLYGLTIVPKRRVHYGKINPRLAREVFIQQALIEGEYDGPRGVLPDFLIHNRRVLDDIRKLEAKHRRRDVLVEAQHIYHFFDARIPDHVLNGPLFEKWRRAAERTSPQLLFLSREDVVRPDAQIASDEQFPDALVANGTRLPLDYRLNPGEAGDGITLVIPIDALHTADSDRAEWLVPGLLRDRVIALIKSLPKALRVHFVPVPDVADGAIKRMEFGRGLLLEELSSKLASMTGIAVPRDAWNPAALPDHLRMNFRVVDDEGSTIAMGRDLAAIKARLGAVAAARRSAALKNDFERNHVVAWDFGDLPDHLSIVRGQTPMLAYPAIVDKGSTVSLTLFDSPQSAAVATRAGLRRLFVLQVQEELTAHIEYLADFDQMTMHFAPLGSSADLRVQLLELVADRVFLGEMPEVRTQTDFERRLRGAWSNLWPATSEVGAVVSRILAGFHTVNLLLFDADNPFLAEAVADTTQQLARLTPCGFLVKTPYAWLLHYPRYLQAIGVRLRKLSNAGLARDHTWTLQIRDLWERYEHRRVKHESLGVHDPALEQFRWMIEELRVSLFAQELRTSIPISGKRMEQQWAHVHP